jgi:hypothetical protein
LVRILTIWKLVQYSNGIRKPVQVSDAIQDLDRKSNILGPLKNRKSICRDLYSDARFSDRNFERTNSQRIFMFFLFSQLCSKNICWFLSSAWGPATLFSYFEVSLEVVVIQGWLLSLVMWRLKIRFSLKNQHFVSCKSEQGLALPIKKTRKILRILAKFSDFWKFRWFFKFCSYQKSQGKICRNFAT